MAIVILIIQNLRDKIKADKERRNSANIRPFASDLRMRHLEENLDKLIDIVEHHMLDNLSHKNY